MEDVSLMLFSMLSKCPFEPWKKAWKKTDRLFINNINSGHLSNTASLHLTSCLNTQLQFVADFSVLKQITNVSSQKQTHFFLLFLNSCGRYVLFFALLVVGNMLTASSLATVKSKKQEPPISTTTSGLWYTTERKQKQLVLCLDWEEKKRSCQSTGLSFFHRVSMYTVVVVLLTCG